MDIFAAKRGADRLAREVARLVDRGVLDPRSRAADALLDYLEVGSPGGPKTVPEWCEEYDGAQSKKAHPAPMKPLEGP